MPKINLLSQEIAELIAAGEVVERPASVVKELVENSIDAGARHITVEIQRGGILYIRVTDDGCGIDGKDVPLAFLRHATSKINNTDDLYSIATLGFRGEALAATAAVSRIEMLTKTADVDYGTRYLIEGGVEVLLEDCGCPDGTTIIIRDIFFNTPARMKFLKKDVSEGNAVAGVIERAALSHPEIAFKFIREGKQVLSSAGDGKLSSAIYSVLGRDFSKGLLSVSGGSESIKVDGFTCKPVMCRQSRAGQYIFLNGRLVKSGTVTAAVEQAYRNQSMVGKFPAFVLNVMVPFDMVDVNVHPAKTEVRFADERKVFEAVHYAVKSSISVGDTRPVIDMTATQKRADNFTRMSVEEYRNIPIEEKKTVVEQAYFVGKAGGRLHDVDTPYFMQQDVKKYISKQEVSTIKPKKAETPVFNENKVDVNISYDVIEEKNPVPENDVQKPPVNDILSLDSKSKNDDLVVCAADSEIELRYIGEAFSTYIVVEKDDSIFLIDKHAAHERIIYNDMKDKRTVHTQALLTPVTVRLGSDEYSAVLENITLFEDAGFEIEDFGNATVIVRAVPATLVSDDVESVVTEAASNLCERGSLEIEKLDHLYHTVACKAAIKAGNKTTPQELIILAKRVLSDRNVMYCPHGRPVAFEIKKRDLEKQFGRIQ